MKRPSIVYIVACLWCWATLLPLRAVPLWVHLAGGGAPTGGVQSPTTTDLIAYWSLENLDDASGNSRTLTGWGTEDHTTGKVANSIRFNAGSEYGRIDDAEWQTPVGDFTVSGWVYYTDATPATEQGIVTKYNAVSLGRSWGVFIGTAGTLYARVSSNGDTGVFTTPSGTIPTATWFHFAMVFDASASLKMYYNGVLLATETTSIPAAVYNTTTRLNIGAIADVNTESQDRRFDEVGIWNRVLTDGEIEWLYNSGSGRAYTDLNL